MDDKIKIGEKRTTTGENKRWFKVISYDQFQRARYALIEKDFEELSKILKKVKMTKDNFYILCRDAINSNEILPLKTILDMYPSFWNQELFDMMTEYIMRVKSFKLASFLSLYIDKVNNYNKSIDDWNDHVRNKKLKDQNVNSDSVKQNVFKKFISKIHNIFMKEN